MAVKIPKVEKASNDNITDCLSSQIKMQRTKPAHHDERPAVAFDTEIKTRASQIILLVNRYATAEAKGKDDGYVYDKAECFELPPS